MSPRGAAGEAADDGPLDLAARRAWMASRSPGEAAAKPASMTSTPSSCEGPGHLELLPEVHGEAGALLAVAQGGVEDDRRDRGDGPGRRRASSVSLDMAVSRAPVRGRRSDSRHRDRPLRPVRRKRSRQRVQPRRESSPAGRRSRCALRTKDTGRSRHTESGPRRVNEPPAGRRPIASPLSTAAAPSLRSSSTKASSGMVLRSSPPRRRGRDPLRLDLLLAHHQREGDLLQLGVADLGAELLAGVVELDAEALGRRAAPPPRPPSR